jgi:hypothetical protein
MFVCVFVYSIWNSVSESIYFPEKPLEKKLGYKFGRYIGNKLRKKMTLLEIYIAYEIIALAYKLLID